MNWAAACAAIIPCLNEEKAIAQVVSASREQVHKVIVVDDGSVDATAAAAQRAGAEVLRHPATQGKGSALQTGWARAAELGFQWALTLDGDGQHNPQDAPRFFDCAQSGSSPLIVGNRMGDAQSMPWLRRFVNRWLSRRLTTLTGQVIPDSQCGFRLMQLEAWSAIPVTASHFEIESEVLLRFLLQGFRVEFVPIQVIYKGEQSKIHPFLDTIRWFRWWRAARQIQREQPRPLPPS